MLKNAYLLAEIGADTAENERNLHWGSRPRALGGRGSRPVRNSRWPRVRANT